MLFPRVFTLYSRLKTHAPLGLLVIAALLVGTIPVTWTEPQAARRSPDEVVAVIPDDAPPIYFRDDKTGKASGFAVDLMDAIARQAGIRVEYVFARGWTNIINMVVSGEADLIPVIGISDERKKQLAYTEEVGAFPIAFFIHSHSKVGAWTAEGRTIGVITDSLAYEKLKNRPSIRFKMYDSFVNGLRDLLAQKIDAFACPAPIFLKLARESDLEDHIQMIEQPIAEIHEAIGVRKDNIALLDRLNKAMAGFIGGEDYKRIYHTWYGKPTPYWTRYKIVAVSAAVIVIIIILMAGWRYLSILRLHRELNVSIAERKQAEIALRENVEKFHALFEGANDAVLVHAIGQDTSPGLIREANETAVKRLGYSLEELRRMSPTDFNDPRYLRHLPYTMEKLRRDGCAVFETVHMTKDGRSIPVEVSARVVRLNGIPHLISIVRDVTERKEAEEKIKKAEEMSRKYSLDLERLLSISRETTMTTDLKGLYRTFVSASRELLNLDFSTLMLLSEDKKTLTMQDSLGFPEAMIGRFSIVEGQGLATLLVKSKKPETVADFASETRFEIPPIVREKNIRSAMAVPMMMKDDIIGVLVGHTLARRDFSQKELDIYQHIANQAAVAIRNAMNTDILRKSEKYIRDVTAALGEGVFALNANGETTFMNPEAETLLGWSEKELLHKNIHHIIHNRRADGTPLLFEECEMRKVIETGNRFHSAEELFIKKDGAIFPVSVHSTPLMENGKVVASVTAFRDISERKQREQEREKLIADLRKALAQIKTLHGIVPICASCKKIRDDEGAWHQLEVYISEHTDAQFSHGLCKECAKKLYPEFYRKDKKKTT